MKYNFTMKVRTKLKKAWEGIINSEQRTANQVEIAERKIVDKLVLDAYGRKGKLLKFSFLQGVFFGLGSAIGGTIVLAMVIWVLSQMVDWFPLMGDFVDKIIEYTGRR